MARWIFHRKNGNINLLMPFLTYSIEPELAENFDQTNAKNIEKFLTYIDLLNNKKRAILVDKNNKVLENLSKKYFDTIGKISSIDEHIFSEKIQSLVRILNDSIQYKNKIGDSGTKIDFEKNIKNEIDKNLFNKFNNDVFPPSLFKFSVKVFEEEFLNKIKTYIISKNSDKRKINYLFVFHKEASKYLEGYSGKKPNLPISDKDIKDRLKDPKENHFYKTNVMKIKSGLNVLVNWWVQIPKIFRPKNFVFLSDTPINVYKSHKYNIDKRKKMSKFLFENCKEDGFKAELIFLDPSDLRKQWWKHKRHFVFGEDSSLIVDSECGIEFVNEHDEEKINDINKFVIVSDKENLQLNDLSQQINLMLKSK